MRAGTVMSDPTPTYKDDAEISTLVSAFESCSFHPSEFKHYQHLAVAFWYVSHLPFAEAGERMKNGIRRLAATYGKTGYGETVTVFWLKIVQGFFASADPEDSLATRTNKLIANYGDPKLIFAYYSSELLTSPEAKAEWVEPDLKPFGF